MESLRSFHREPVSTDSGKLFVKNDEKMVSRERDEPQGQSCTTWLLTIHVIDSRGRYYVDSNLVQAVIQALSKDFTQALLLGISI